MDLTQYKPLTNILPLHNQKQFDFEKLAFSLDRPVEKPVPVISISGEMIATPGNLTVFAGAAKSGKSAYITACLGGCLALPGDPTIDLLGLTVARNEGEKAVLHFDTEQSDWNHFKSVSNAYKRASRSKDLSHFQSFNIRPYKREERKQFIEGCLAHYSEICGGVFMWVLDGIADLVGSVNNEEEVNDVIEWGGQLCVKYDCPLITVLHFNPGTSRVRGHIGSQVERKCESVLAITKIPETDDSQLTAVFTRNTSPGKIPAIDFGYDTEKGYHVTRRIISPLDKQENKETQKRAKQEQKEQEARAREQQKEAEAKAKADEKRLKLAVIFERIFANCSDNGEIKYNDLVDLWIECEGGVPITAKRNIKAGVLHKILETTITGKYKFCFKL